MRAKVNKEKCLGCGMCVSLCPQVFELKDFKADVKAGVDCEENCDCINEALESCPAGAIEKTEKND